MSSRRLKQISYEAPLMDLNFSSFPISTVKSTTDFFKQVKSVLCRFDVNRKLYVLQPNWNEHKTVKYEIMNSEELIFKPRVGEFQIFQMNISKKGRLNFEFDSKAGQLIINHIKVGGKIALDRITQNGIDIDFEITDFGRPNEELLRYAVMNKDGSVNTGCVDAYFSYSEDDEDQESEELDLKLMEITKGWHQEIFG